MRGCTGLLLPLLLLVLAACGEEPDSGGEFVTPPESRDLEEPATGPRPRDPDVSPSPRQSSPRTARIGTWSIPERDWPLTVSEGVVRCQERDGRPLVTFVTPDARVYGVNGAAVSRGLPRIDPIWRRDPDLPGGRADISPLLERGLSLCE